MIPDQINAAINAWAWADAKVGGYGLGIALAVLGICAVIYGTRHRTDYRTFRDHVAADLHGHQQPHPEPDQPGTNQHTLNTCRAIWHATHHREEKP
ncbi:hypothetical protein ACL02U_11865 [Streptomyces sp. MS06]|uniref:hypothetical protein n=1 Tax=Streptomyces sp. MS06 TaxID=3385974 RepID=UPI0039A0179C